MASVDVVSRVMELSGVKELNPVQRLALDKGLLEGKSMVVCAPTASGKTLVAEIACLDAVLNRGKKALYIVPLRALASEKYEEFRQRYGFLRVGISVGDLDKADPWLAEKDIIIVTSEKLDSLLRHGIGWQGEIGLVVADEIHLMDDPGRGPTLEVVLTRLKRASSPVILALSATISNYLDLAEWLGAVPVKSDFRPVQLYVGVSEGRKVWFNPEREVALAGEKDAVRELVEQALDRGKQALVFIGTRRNAEAAAEKLGPDVRRRLSAQEKAALGGLADRVLNVLDRPTRQCERLSGMVRDGVAFHHAGLTNEQRSLIERGFRDGLVKVLSATPTLAAGVNIPAWRVIIRDLKRFGRGGMDYLPVLEVHQMAGRAGRPRYDTEGEAVLVARSEAEARLVWDRYVTGRPENIYSKLGVEPVLRMHVLALVASGLAPDTRSLVEFFSGTFYAHQYGDVAGLQGLLSKVVAQLKGYGFVRGSRDGEEGSGEGEAGTGFGEFRTGLSIQEGKEEGLWPTKVGRRVSELYIKGIGILEERGTNDFGVLHLVSNTLEMRPFLGVRKGDAGGLDALLAVQEPFLAEKPPNPWDIEHDDYMRSIKTAWLLKEWAEEAGEDVLLDNFSVTPGELRVRLSNADWLLYSAYELGLLLNLRRTIREARKVRVRVRYGVKEDLLPLVALKGVGRVRARRLWGAGLRKLDDLRKAPLEGLERAVGPAAARQIKGQL
jgi:helicase